VLNNVTLPQYAYSIERDVWFPWSNPAVGGIYYNFKDQISDDAYNPRALMRDSGTPAGTVVYTALGGQEDAPGTSQMTSPQMLVGEGHKDYTLDNVLIRYTASGVVTLTIGGSVRLNGATVNFTPVNVVLAPGTGQVSVPMRGSNATGQFHNLSLSTTLQMPTNVIITELDLFYQEAGNFRA
jgi:hypothetical protein